MKYILCLVIAFFTLSSEASLKLSGQVNAYDKNENPRPQVGLSYYQKLTKKGMLALNSYVGYGNEPFEVKADANWFVAKSQLDFNVGRFTVSPGVLYKYVDPYDQSRSYFYMRVDYKILD